MKKTAKNSGTGVLEDGSGGERAVSKVQESHSWGSEIGDTTEFESIDMEKECLVEETSFDYGKGGALTGGDLNQTPTGLKVKTKKTLGKPLRKINFSQNSNGDSVLSNAPLELLLSLKNLVNVSVRKSFALDISLNKVADKSSQEKFVVLWGVSTLSKFSEIIRATFTSKSSLMKATDKAASVKILVNTDFKKSSEQSDWAVVIKEIPIGTSAKAVRTVLSEFGVIKVIKMQLIGLWQKTVVEFEQPDQTDLVAAKWSILIGKDAVCVAKTDSNKKAWNARD
ncbi:hypothetical protein G9A89_016913 [Geosiphon pyriformis]|nr:hypothetical protein G9A89_016913 [Geosiphon pyriformis]